MSSLKKDAYDAIWNPNELYHHGIKGQKWGVRRFENYDGSLTYAGKLRYGRGLIRSNSRINRDISTGHHYYNKMKDTSLNEIFEKKKNRLSSDFEKDIQKDAKAVNKGGMASAVFLKNRDENCALCTTAYELRRRGYDVIASTGTGLTYDGIRSIYKNPPEFETYAGKSWMGLHDKDLSDNESYALAMKSRQITRDQFRRVEKKLLAQGNGARGNLCIEYVGGYGGHSIAYEIHKNKLYIIDGQIGKVYKDPFDAMDGACCVSGLRTDNLKIDYNVAKKYMRNRSESRWLKNEGVSDTGKQLISLGVRLTFLIWSLNKLHQADQEMRKNE